MCLIFFYLVFVCMLLVTHQFQIPIVLFCCLYLFIFRITLLFSLLFASQCVLRVEVLGLSHLNYIRHMFNLYIMLFRTVALRAI